MTKEENKSQVHLGRWVQVMSVLAQLGVIAVVAASWFSGASSLTVLVILITVGIAFGRFYLNEIYLKKEIEHLKEVNFRLVNANPERAELGVKLKGDLK